MTALKSTVRLVVATVVLRLFGFVRDIVLAAGFGAGVVSDAFMLSSNIPLILFDNLAIAVANSFLPQYQSLDKDKDYFFSNVINLLLVAGIVLSLLFMFVPQVLVFLFASQLDSATFSLTSSFLQVTIWITVPLLLMAVLRISLHSQGVFFSTQVTLICVNVFIVVAIVFGSYTGNLSLLPIGVLLGHVLYLGILVVMVGHRGVVYRPWLNIRDSRILAMLPFLLPLFASALGTELSHIIDKNFASALEPGTISALGYASRMSKQFHLVIGVSIVTVMYPKMLDLGNQGETDKLVGYVKKFLQVLVPIMLPFTAGLILMAEPAVALIYERGAFTPENTRVTAECLQMYAIGVGFTSINVFLSRTFFALQDTKTPFRMFVVSLCVSIVLNLVLIGPLQHMGLALSTSLSSVVYTGLLLWVLVKRMGSLGLSELKLEWLKALIATLIMSFIVWGGLYLLPVRDGNILQTVAWVSVLVIVGVGVYILVHVLLRTVFLRDSIAMAKRFLSRKL